MARDRSAPMGLATQELAAVAAAVVAVGSAAVGIGFGLYWLLDTGSDFRFGEIVTTHPRAGIGFVTLAFGLFLAVTAWLVAMGFRSQARPRRHALRVAAAAERARADEL